MPLYCDTLLTLKQQPPSLESLHSIAPFLVSAFVQVPPPALGPLAFEAFWKETYHLMGQVQGSYPVNIKRCLKTYDMVFDDNLAANISSELESQSSVGVCQYEVKTSVA
jgi:hypothetical protein